MPRTKAKVQGQPIELAIGAKEIVVLDEDGLEQGVLEGFVIYGKQTLEEAIADAIPAGYSYWLRPLAVN